MDVCADPPAAGAARPLVWLAAALGAGTLVGLDLAEGLRPATAAGGLALLAAGLLAARRGRAPRWVPWVLALAGLRASALALPPRLAGPLGAEAVRALRTEPESGLWRAEPGGRRGWIEPFAGAERRPPLLYEVELAAPAEGTPVVALPGGEAVPWARGPEPARDARARRFAALAPLAPDELVRLAPDARAGARLRVALGDLRAAVGARVRRVEGPRSRGLLEALAIGARGTLTAAQADLFARTGTSHLLAISGWHVGLLAALLLAPLARVAPRGRRGLVVLGLNAALLAGFAVLAGGEKPVLRATLAFLLLQLGAWRRRGARARPRRPDALSFLALAFALECLLDPPGIRALSLALTYAATLGLILGTGALASLLRAPREPFEELARGPWGRAAARVADGLRGALAASAVAVLATLPLAWTTFGELAPVGVVVTLLALPAFTALSLLAWLASLWPAPALTPACELAAGALYGVLEHADRLPATPLLLPPRPLALLVAATALTFLALRHARARRAAALTWALVLLPWSAAPAGLELHALDVGHGSAAVLRAPGLPALVFDAGSRDRRAIAGQALLPLLARWEVPAVVVALSHADHDHASALARLVERVPAAAWLGPLPPREPGARSSRAPSDPRSSSEALAPLDLEAGLARWHTRCPALGLALLRAAPVAGNEGSRALLVEWRGARLLLTGDAEEGGLAGLALPPGPLRLLLAPHHGADAPALAPFLARHPPAEVWISGSSPPAIAAELARRRLPWRWTGRDGPLALRLE
ncbi:MAG TPA: ComEC/Rec2 family competence protein [Planctomycetota bacterium]